MPPLLPAPGPGGLRGPGLLKAALDVLVALLLLVVLFPVLLTLALAVCADGGHAFFRQTRVGLDGREFTMVKFRSMVVDAGARLAALQAENEGAGPLFKLRHDPRVTRVGAALRKYSLDELPQLFNVLTGTMSLIGPRPALPHEVATYATEARRRLAVKPGLTGLWQVSGRSDLSWEESIALGCRRSGYTRRQVRAVSQQDQMCQ